MSVLNLVERRLKDIEHLRTGHKDIVQNKRDEIDYYTGLISDLDTEEEILKDHLSLLTAQLEKVGKTE
jgi:hypothetical protein